MVIYLPAILKVKIIEYLCDSECWTNLDLFVKDVYHWFLAEPGLYKDMMGIDRFRIDIRGEAWLKYLDEKIYGIETRYIHDEIIIDRFDEYIKEADEDNDNCSYMESEDKDAIEGDMDET